MLEIDTSFFFLRKKEHRKQQTARDSVPGNGVDPLARELAREAGLNVWRMLAGDLDDSGWSRLAAASAELGERQPDNRTRLAALVAAIDNAYAARVTP